MMDRLQLLVSLRFTYWLLAAGLVAVAVVLAPLAYDFGGTTPWLFLPTWTLYLGTLVIAGANILDALRGRRGQAEIGPWAWWLLALAIPVALLGSILDCMGLTFDGCSTSCTFLMTTWAPLSTVLVLVFAAVRRPELLAVLTTTSFVYLIPNCVCDNPVNARWIDWMGSSPACFATSFGVSVIASAALATRQRVGASIALSWAIVGMQAFFFIGHHYFNFPW